MLPTRFGAAIWVSPDMADAALRARIVGTLAGLPPIGSRLNLAAKTFRTQVRILNRLGPAASPTRAALTRLGVFEPAIAAVEKAGELPYPPMRPSDWILRQMAEQLPKLVEIENQRAAAVAVYAEGLANNAAVTIPAAARRPAPLLRFPLYATDNAAAEKLIDHLTKNGVFAGRWYRPELFPGAVDPSKYHYDPADPELPITREATARILNLPTNVTEAEANRIVELLV
jgi:hypothetical protein